MERVGEAEKTQIHTEVEILKSLTHKVNTVFSREAHADSYWILAAHLNFLCILRFTEHKANRLCNGNHDIWNSEAVI